MNKKQLRLWLTCLTVMLAGLLVNADNAPSESKAVNLVIKCYSIAPDVAMSPDYALFTAADSARVESLGTCYNTNDSTLTVFNLKPATEYLLQYAPKNTTKANNDAVVIESSSGRKVTGRSCKGGCNLSPDGCRWLRISIPAVNPEGIYRHSESIILK